MAQDTLGSGTLWGARTARWLARSRAGAMKYQERRLHPIMYDALAMVYKAKLATGAADDERAIVDRLKTQILTEILSGQHKEQMVVDPLSSPAGEAVLDNLNDIVETRVLGLSRSAASDPALVSQGLSGADYYLAASRLAALIAIKDLESTLLELERLVRRKSLEIEMTLSVAAQGDPARTGRLDACRQFRNLGNVAERHLGRIKSMRERLLEVSLCESRNFCQNFAVELSVVSGYKFRASDIVETGKVNESALIDLVSVASMQKELALELTRLCRAFNHIEDEFQDGAGLVSFKDTLHLACLRVQAEEMQVSLAMQTDLGSEQCPAISLAGESILASVDALKSSIRSFNHGYVTKAVLR